MTGPNTASEPAAPPWPAVPPPGHAFLPVSVQELEKILARLPSTAHRRRAFEIFETVKAAIGSGAVTSIAEIDAAFA